MQYAINKFIDHTLLKPTATATDIKNLCKEAIDNDFFAVCVNSCYVELAKKELKNSRVKVCSVVGFPLGAMHTDAKAFEAKLAIDNGADEVDMVINLGLIKSQNWEMVQKDIEMVKNAIGNKVLKVILETSYLNEEEITKVCEIAVLAQADYLKTSTGFASSGATEEDVRLMKKAVNNQAKIKASGGIRDLSTALTFIKLGVTRIGTSSGVKIINQQRMNK